MKSMKLYVHVERIYNELRELGLDKAGQLSVDALTPFDQYHYLGTEAVDEAARSLQVTPDSRVLEIGSGIGGPARYLAARTGCSVVALELQLDLHETGRSLTARCGLEDRVRHVAGDVLAAALDGGGFDGIMSFLVFLHIPDRKRLFDICHAALKPGHAMYIEDFVLNGRAVGRAAARPRDQGHVPLPARCRRLRARARGQRIQGGTIRGPVTRLVHLHRAEARRIPRRRGSATSGCMAKR